jgi:hypothetical protein
LFPQTKDFLMGKTVADIRPCDQTIEDKVFSKRFIILYGASGALVRPLLSAPVR